MSGLQKKGPKKRKSKKVKNDLKFINRLPTVEELNDEREFDEFKKMMEDSPSYRRHNGALRSVK